jgi:hypothetical protein
VVRLNHRDDCGAIALLVAILAVVLFGFAAIVVDLGYARTVKSDAQSAVDAASLAGANIVANDSSPSAQTFADATSAIEDVAKENFGTSASDWAGCSATAPSPSWVRAGSGTDCILFNSNANNPSKLQVVLPSKHVDSFFGGLFGYQGADIGAVAQATIREGSIRDCALCVLGLLDTSGPVRVDDDDPVGGPGSSASAVSGRVGTGGSITVQDPGVITFANKPTPARGSSYSPNPPLLRPVNDPFAGQPMPADSSNFPDPSPTRNATCGPGDSLGAGVYRNITVTGPCPATGIIVVTRLLRVQSGGSLSTSSAVIQLSCGTRLAPTDCGSGRAGGRIRIDAGGQISMATTFPTGFSVVADPGNTSPMAIDGSLSVDQAVYALSAAVTLGSGASLSASGRVAVAQLTVGFGGAVDVAAAVGSSIPGPPFVGLYR